METRYARMKRIREKKHLDKLKRPNEVYELEIEEEEVSTPFIDMVFMLYITVMLGAGIIYMTNGDIIYDYFKGVEIQELFTQPIQDPYSEEE